MNFVIINDMIKKGRDLTQSYDKSPFTNRNVKRVKWQHKNTTNYTATVDRLSNVIWINYNHPTGVVNRLTGPTF